MASLKESLLRAMEGYFGEDRRRIEHAHRVTAYAEELLSREGGDYRIVIAVAVLHDIGIREAERKYGSSSGKYQEIEGPPIARQILSGLAFAPEQIEQVCEIIAHHHSPGRITSLDFKVLYDADWLVNLGDEYDVRERTKLEHIIDRVFFTEGGKALARAVYLAEEG